METIFNETNAKDWILLPPGNKEICRHPLDEIPEHCSQAGLIDVLTANLGRIFPWGSENSPENKDPQKRAPKLWWEHRIGYGGLYHDKWFLTTDGRVGGAKNVPEELPGTLRSCLLYDGGKPNAEGLQSNEGYAVLAAVGTENLDFYRRAQMHGAEHVAADGGAIILSPLFDGNRAYAGFVGRCQHCPNPELISFRQLQKALPDYELQLFPEWKNWSLNKSPTRQP